MLNHGYIEPSIYVTGQGMAREQDWLARAGFVVLHTDYRGHAASDPAADLDRETRLGYARGRDQRRPRAEKQPYVDADRMAMLGRSMGGGVTLNALVARPAWSTRRSIYASRQLALPRQPAALHRCRTGPRPRRRCSTGSAPRSEEPAFYRGLSSRTYFDRITEPVLMHHGTVDGTCPLAVVAHHPAAAREGRRRQHPGRGLPRRGARVLARWQDSIVRTRARSCAASVLTRRARRVDPSPVRATVGGDRHRAGAA